MVVDKKSSIGQVRIVAGDWRGRKIPVLDSTGLRPTSDRVRETLFNWLMSKVPGSRCLDLFAGSGALGIEAASRGAKSVHLVEQDKRVSNQLRLTLSELRADDRLELFTMPAEQYLATRQEPFDLVFIDPPFELDLHERILELIVDGHLNENAWLYLELPTKQAALIEKLPDSLELYRDKRFGDVTVYLLKVRKSDA